MKFVVRSPEKEFLTDSTSSIRLNLIVVAKMTERKKEKKKKIKHERRRSMKK